MRISLLIMAFALSALSALPVSAQVATETLVQGSTELTAEQNWQEDIIFYVFAALLVVSSIGVVVAGTVVRMAMWLFSAFGAVAMLFFMLQAHFLAAVQLIVYAGGILVLIIFGIMLTTTSPWLKFDIKKSELIVSGLACAGLCVLMCAALLGSEWDSTPLIRQWQMREIGQSLLTDYLVPFEVASVLLLVVMIGAAYLAKQDKEM